MSDQQSAAFSSQRLWGTIGGIVLFLAVAIGAFGAHVVSERVLPAVHAEQSPQSVAGFAMPASYKAYLNYQTAVLYQMVHGVGLILVGLLGRRGKARRLAYAAGVSFLSGIFLFCGPLYAMATTGIGGIHLIVPLGGICFLVGWMLFVTAAAMPRTRGQRS